jgi:predicted RNA-binding Zn-ribbon protein involved in translation (DUF1610 family)
MEDESFYSSLWRNLRSTERYLVLRLAVSLASGLLLLSAATAAAWVAAQFGNAGYRGRVRDEHVLVALLLASICWLVMLVPIWSRMRHGKRFIVPAITTVCVSILTIGSMAAIDEFLARDEEFLMTAVGLLGLAVVILVWLPTAQRAIRGRPVVGRDGLVQVNCPQCGYSLIGLRDLRCPECGTEFTIDELIRAQSYSGVPKANDESEAPSLPRLRSTSSLEGERQRGKGARDRSPALPVRTPPPAD